MEALPLAARCSWCLATSTHTLHEKSRIGRDVYSCAACKKRTLPCKRCMVSALSRSGSGSGSDSGSGAGSGSPKRSGGSAGSSTLSFSSAGGSAALDEDLLEIGMAQDGVWSEDYCLVCKETLACWPSPIDDEPKLARTGTVALGSPALGRSPGSGRMRGTTTLSHTQSRAPAPTQERQDIPAADIQKLQVALLEAQRSVLVRVDNKTPHRMYLIDDATLIERDGLAGGDWCSASGPPREILPNQACAFATVSKGKGMGGTSARVGYEFRDKATKRRVAAVQLRWVNPLVKGPKGNWCETRTDYSTELGPKVTRSVQGMKDHSTVTFEVLWGDGGPDHFNPHVVSKKEGWLRALPVQELRRAATPGGMGSDGELRSQVSVLEELPKISVWQNQRRPPLVGDFTESLLVPGVDPSPWSDSNSHGSYAGLEDPALLPADCVWCDGVDWQPLEWEFAVSFATSGPRSLYSSFSPRKGITDLVRRREWQRACIPDGNSKHTELVAALQAKLVEAPERSMVATVHNSTNFPMVLESAKAKWGAFVPGGQPRSLIPASTSVTIGMQATTMLTGVEGKLTFSVKPTASTGPATTVFVRFVNPKVQSELGNWCETKTTGADAAPRLAINRTNPTQLEHSMCTFTVVENPSAASPNTHYNPAQGLDAGEGVASATVEGMASASLAGNDGLRLYLGQSSRSTLVTFTNLSSRKLKLTHLEVTGGSWAKSREPPAAIEPNSVVSFGASCSVLTVADLKIRVTYLSEMCQGEWQGVWFDQQAGFALKCKNPSPARFGKGCTFTKYLLGDDTMGLKVAKQDSTAEQAGNNEWNFLITDGEDPYTIYTSRKQDLTARLRNEERSMIIAIANRCAVPLVLQGSNGILSAGRWVEPPPARVNPGQTSMMALKPHMLELSGGIKASLKYTLADVAQLEKMKASGSSMDDLTTTASTFGGVAIEFSNWGGSKNSYRSVSSGNVFCERLVDPHDVDQRMENDTHASATFVVEQAAITTVNIGTSAENSKTVASEGVLGAESVAINADAEGKPDLFDVRVEQSTVRIVVRRVDAPGGWDHDLTIRARMDPAKQEAEESSSTDVQQASAGGTVSGFVRIGHTDWMRRGMLFSKERETESNVEWIKEELGLDKDLHTDMALKAACQRMGVVYQPGASSLKLSRDVTQAIKAEVQAQQRPGIFMSHAQANAGPQVRALKPRLQEDCVALQGTWQDLPDGQNEKIWLDVDEQPDQIGMKNGIRRQSCFLIFLTKGYLTRRFCQYEIQWALRYDKKIVLVYETNTEHGHASFGDYIAECPVELRVIFDKSVAVPFYNDEVFGRLSRSEILAQCDLSTTRPCAELASRVLPNPTGPVHIVANQNDSTARAQAENLQQQLQKASPGLQLALLDSQGLPNGSTQSQQAESFIVFLTNHVFKQPAVCGVLMAASRDPVNIVFVAEADMRYNAVGIPLMGGTIAGELRDQVPLKFQQELKDLLDQAKPIPFYPVRLFRDESIAQILAALCQAPSRDGSRAFTDTGAETRPDVLALIHRMELEKEAALAEKDAAMQQLTETYRIDLERKEKELVALRAELALGTAIWEFEHSVYYRSGTAEQSASGAGPPAEQKVWKAYDAHQRDILEVGYRRDPAGHCDIPSVTIGAQSFSYRVDFAKGCQCNLTTGALRKVRRRIVEAGHAGITPPRALFASPMHPTGVGDPLNQPELLVESGPEPDVIEEGVPPDC